MQPTAHVGVAVGGVVLLLFFGLRTMRRRDAGPIRGLTGGSDAYREAARQAFCVEFGGTPPAPPEGLFDGMGGTLFCPSCDKEHPVGTLYCGACGCETVEPEELNDTSARPQPTRPVGAELVCVHVAPSPVQATLAKGYLESHAIPCVTSAHVSTSVYHFTLPPLGEVRLMVHPEDADRARLLLQECR